MKKNKLNLRILLSFLLIFTMFSFKIVDVFADETNTISTEKVANPLYKGVEVQSYSPKSSSSRSSTKVFYTKSSAANYLKNEMVKRSGTIEFTIKTKNYNDLYEDLFNMAVEDKEDTTSSEGDYLYRHWKNYYVEWDDTKSTQTTFTYKMEYLSTYKQEQQVDKQVKKILDELDVYNKDEYTKIKAVHDYITENITYDYELLNYSAYDALVTKNVVCNGYSTLTYKMMKELGLKVRCITGNKETEYHAWNIGKIGSKWYNIDNTWDATEYNDKNDSYAYFLKNNSQFYDHSRDSEFKTSEFNANHPMSHNSYKKEENILLNQYEKIVVEGTKFELEYEILDDNDKIKYFISSNENIAKVDKNGTVTGLNKGIATITATTEKGYTATCKVYVKYDFTNSKITYLDDEKFVYDGKVKKPNISITYDGKLLKEGEDYEIYYGENTLSGKGNMKIYGIGNFSNHQISTFKIYPDKVNKVQISESTPTSLSLSWNRENGVTGYKIYRASTSGGKYTYVSTVSSKKNTYTNTSLTSDTKYYYKIRAYKTTNGYNLYGEYSDVISGKTKYPGQVKNLKQTSSGKSFVSLSWSKATYASGYRIYRSTSKSGTYKLVTELSGNSKTTYTDKNLSSGKTYYYKVKAYRKVENTKNYGSYSNIVKTSTKCSTPIISVSSKDKGKSLISWNKVSNSSGYAIYTSTSKNGTYKKIGTVTSGTTLKFTHSGLKSGKTYYYKVRAYKSADMGNVYSYYSSIKSIKIK